MLTVQASGFAVASLPIDVAPSGQQSVTVTLDVAPLSEDVTVTAEAGRAEIASRSPQAVNVIPQDAITQRTRTVVAQAVAEEAGVHLQRTSPTMAGIFVRGLTGNKVNVFVDGVRYTNGAQRGGVNTFLDLIEPTGLDKHRNPARPEQRAVRERRARRQRAVPVDPAEPVARRPAARVGHAGPVGRHRGELRRRQRPRWLQPFALCGHRQPGRPRRR